jgi:hypothetical protein
MIHVVAMKCLICLPLLIHIELLWRSRSWSFKNRGVGVGAGVWVGSFKNRGVEVGAFVYRLHSPGLCTALPHGRPSCSGRFSISTDTRFRDVNYRFRPLFHRGEISPIILDERQRTRKQCFLILRQGDCGHSKEQTSLSTAWHRQKIIQKFKWTYCNMCFASTQPIFAPYKFS